MAPIGPLVSTEWLEYQLHDEAIRIVDCRFYLAEPERGYAEFRASHIPGATYLSLDEHLTAPLGPGRHPLPDPATFAATMRAAGIGRTHTVIVYDQHDASMASRLWWMLRSLGHENTVVLDGGWKAWSAEPRSTTKEVPRWEPTELSLATAWTGTIDRTGINENDENLFLVDSRSAERHRGEVEPIDPIAGHIPGSFNIPYQGNTDESGRFISIVELQDRFQVVDTTRTVVCYCGSGVTACSNILAMESAGMTGALLYPGSWSDWITPAPAGQA